MVAALGAWLAACASSETASVPPNAGTYKVGAPYEIGDNWYYPKAQTDYDETGMASWYGPTFYGHRTANGEIFDASAMTAAHRTLPMPVNVRVTNLDNGRSAVLRVNDRGPYANGRIIDVSEHAAEVLGFKNAGTAHVRVQYLARADGDAPPDDSSMEVVSNDRGPAPPASGDGGSAVDDAAEAARTAALNAGSVGGAAVAATPAMVRPMPSMAVAAVPMPDPSADGDDPAANDGAVEEGSGPAADVPPPSPVTVATLEPNPVQQTSPQSFTALPTRGDLTPVIGGDPNAPAPPPLVAQNDSATGQVPATAAPYPAAPPSARTRIYVQAGAFSSRNNADHLIGLLGAIGSFFVSPVERAGAELYRVRMGPFDDIGDATAALAGVTGLGNTGAKIVVDQ